MIPADVLTTLVADAPVRLVQLTALLAVLLLVDRLARRRVWPQLLAVLWWLVPLRAVLPSSIGGAWTAHTATQVPATPVGADLAAATMPGWMVVWLVGTITIVGVATVRRLRDARRVLGRARAPTDDDPVRVAADRVRARHPSLSRVELLRSAAASGPMVVGLLRPRIVLPPHDGEGTDELVHVLLHELEHVRRWDPLRRELVLVGTALLWFHPLAWIARRRVEELREICCDVAVAARLGNDAPAYRRTLLATARDWLPGEAAGLGWISPRHPLIERLDWIERRAWRHPVRRRLTSLAAALLVVACAMPAVERLAPPMTNPVAAPHEREIARQVEAAERALARSARGDPGCLEARYAALYLHRVRAEANTATATEETPR